MPAKVLWPSREPLYSLMVTRATIGHTAFESEYQNNPVNPSMCEWPEEYFQHGAFWFDEWPKELLVRVISLDPSKGKNDRQGDYSAIVKYGVERCRVGYVEADLRRRPVDVMCADLAQAVQDFRPDVVAIETNAFQELLVNPIRQACEAIHLDTFPIREISNMVPKQVRIRRLTGPLSQKRLRFKSRSPGTLLTVQQAKDWSASQHDDGIDALEMAMRTANEWLAGKKKAQQPTRIIAR